VFAIKLADDVLHDVAERHAYPYEHDRPHTPNLLEADQVAGGPQPDTDSPARRRELKVEVVHASREDGDQGEEQDGRGGQGKVQPRAERRRRST